MTPSDHAKDTRTIRERIEDASQWEPNTGCQLWIAAIDRSGYPRITYKQRRMNAHRLSLLDSLGLDDSPLHVLHKCDVTLCVNPDHMYLGTHRQNMADLSVRSARKPPRKYRRMGATEKLEIVARRQAGQGLRSIGRDMGVDAGTVRRVLALPTPPATEGAGE